MTPMTKEESRGITTAYELSIRDRRRKGRATDIVSLARIISIRRKQLVAVIQRREFTDR